MNSIVIIILGIIIIVLLVILYMYYYSFITPLIKYANLNLDNPPVIYTNITNPLSTRFAYSVWIYINSWVSPKTKSNTQYNLFYRDTEIGLALDNTRPILYCNFNNNKGAPSSNPDHNIIVSNNFPIQTWTNIIINVDNNYLDIYLNGQLISSVVLKTQYSKKEATNYATDNIYIGGTVTISDTTSDIYLANLQRWGQAINPQTAYYNYLNGLRYLPNDSTAFKLNLSLLKDNNLVQTLNL